MNERIREPVDRQPVIKNLFTRGIETFRQPDRNPRCYEMPDQERLSKSRQLISVLASHDPP
jgi:hypothetical protein